MNNIYTLEDWSVREYGDFYTAPELHSRVLNGRVFGNPRFEDGEIITTSNIKSSEGRVVSTRNSKYKLGKPNPTYLDYLKGQGLTLDEAQPVKVLDA